MGNKYKHLAPSNTAKRRALFDAVRGSAKACLRKVTIGTQAAAEAKAKRSRAPMHAYNCRFCHLWHLASGPAPDPPQKG